MNWILTIGVAAVASLLTAIIASVIAYGRGARERGDFSAAESAWAADREASPLSTGTVRVLPAARGRHASAEPYTVTPGDDTVTLAALDGAVVSRVPDAPPDEPEQPAEPRWTDWDALVALGRGMAFLEVREPPGGLPQDVQDILGAATVDEYLARVDEHLNRISAAAGGEG